MDRKLCCGLVESPGQAQHNDNACCHGIERTRRRCVSWRRGQLTIPGGVTDVLIALNFRCHGNHKRAAKNRPAPAADECPLMNCQLNRSTQHSISKRGKMECMMIRRGYFRGFTAAEKTETLGSLAAYARHFDLL